MNDYPPITEKPFSEPEGETEAMEKKEEGCCVKSRIKRTALLLFLAVSYIAWQVITNTSGKFTYILFKTRYSFYATQVMNICYVLFAYPILWSLITFRFVPRVKGYCWWLAYFVLACIDALGCILLGIGNEFTPGPLQTILSQTTIPVTVICSSLILCKSYSPWSLLGATVIIGGVALSVAAACTNSAFTDFKWSSAIVYGMGQGIFGLSFTLKELFFKMQSGSDDEYEELEDGDPANAKCCGRKKKIVRRPEPIHLTSHVALIMVPISFAIEPIQAIPGFGGLNLSDLPRNIWYGMKCNVGINTLPGDDCGWSWLPLLWYSIGTFGAGVTAVYMTKVTSALFQYVVNALVVPLNALIYTLPFMGIAKEPWNIAILASIVTVLFGICIFAVSDPDVIDWGGTKKAKGENATNDDETNDSGIPRPEISIQRRLPKPSKGEAVKQAAKKCMSWTIPSFGSCVMLGKKKWCPGLKCPRIFACCMKSDEEEDGFEGEEKRGLVGHREM